MHFKKVTSLFLAIFILFSNLGLAFSVHYCHDKIANISLQYKHQEADTGCCEKLEKTKKCCSDNTIQNDNQTDNILTKLFQLDLQVLVLGFSENYNFSPEIISVFQRKLFENYSESNSPPLYKLYCQLVFYA